jgi:hypothetical protein
MAEARARNRILHPFGGGSEKGEFRRQWRLRWIAFAAVILWIITVAVMLVVAIWDLVAA